MPSLPELTSPLAGPGARLRAAAERDIPEVLIAHQDDRHLAAALGLKRAPSGAELGRRTELADDERVAGTALWLTILAPDPDDDECRGQLEVTDVDFATGRAALSLWVAPRDRGRGLATGALALAGRWLLTATDLARIELGVPVDNVALTRAAAQAGYVEEGTLRAHIATDGGRADVRAFALVAADLGAQ
jgi:RimJ/RimL family protein N-acetyltransferase